MTYTKAMLVEALQNVQAICPPRPSRQDKAYLEMIVERALNLPHDHPTRLALKCALKDAKSHHTRIGEQ
jgi:hypothetical protein